MYGLLETNISFTEFDTPYNQVAPVIYGSSRHEITSLGVILGPKIVEGLRQFLRAYNKFVNAPDPCYYRIDAYFNEDGIIILEVNASFVDGWGTALNLARASRIVVNRALLQFPKFFATLDPVYLPELRLFASELEQLCVGGNTICNDLGEVGDDESAYVYGRFDSRRQTHYPREGVRIDNKMNLARFSQEWHLKSEGGDGWIQGHEISIPDHYIGCNGHGIKPTPWETLQADIGDQPSFGRKRRVVLKFCDKGSPECVKYRKSVVIGIPEGKNKYLRQCYQFGKLIAQEYIPPTKTDGRSSDNCQLVILSIGDEPVTGYVQYSSKDIINDNSVHGPLALIG